jgi:hypothetical protein
MPFYAVIEPSTGDILEVTPELDHAIPPGATIIELPAKEDDIRSWLARWRKDRAGGGGKELLLDAEDEDDGRGGGPPEGMRDAEAFFARLQQELIRCEVEGRPMVVLLFELAHEDRSIARQFVEETMAAAGQEILPCDLLAEVRDHLAAVIMPDIDGRDLAVEPPRGAVTRLTYPTDREQLEELRRRRHPLLRRGLRRSA